MTSIIRTLSALLSCATILHAAELPRPNIVWIVAEDMSPLIGPYAGPHEVQTPHLDRMAAEGVTYDNAFAPSPVCAPARFALITGRYASSHGDSQGMRGWSNLPRPIEFFPKYLRDAGYYTANWGKTDYNTGRYEGGNVDLALRDAWDGTTFIWKPLGDDAPARGPHWRHRPDPAMPFFQQFNIVSTHMSQLFPEELPGTTPRHDPAMVIIPPYQPDTPTVRKYWAHFYNRLEEMDAQVGGVFDDLREDGVLDDTIVFYFSDHGGGLMRSKRFLYDSGTRVPLIIYFGKNYRHLMPQTTEGRLDCVVDFTDFAPTVLKLLDLPIPEYMHGQPFLAKGVEEAPSREYAFIHRERMSEHIDLSRGLHDGRFVYLRRYLPQRRLGPPSAFQSRIPAEAEWYELYLNGDLTKMQAQGLEQKPFEELYDSRFDPCNLTNVAENPTYRAVLERMRGALDAQILGTGDTGFYWRMDPAPATLAETMNLAALAAQGNADSESRLIELLSHASPVARFWAAAGIANLTKPAPRALAALRPLAADSQPIVQAMAAEALARHGDLSMAQAVFPELLKISGRPNPSPCLWVLNAMYQLDQKPFARLIPQVEALASGKGEEANAARWVLHRWRHDEVVIPTMTK